MSKIYQTRNAKVSLAGSRATLVYLDESRVLDGSDAKLFLNKLDEAVENLSEGEVTDFIKTTINERIEKDFYELPASWASALVNDDWSGYSGSEKRAIQAFIESILPWRIVSTTDEPEAYSTRHDAYEFWPKASNIMEFVAYDR